MVALGVFLHALGGFAAGSFYIPFKKVRNWAWESYWLAGGVFSWIIAPWAVAFLVVPGLLDKIRENISYYANGCVAIVEAVATKEVDAAFGWTAFGHLEPKRIEVIKLPKEQQVLRGTCVGMLSFAKQPKSAKQFMDFLVSAESRAFYRKYGWEIPAG
jgi:hypothetical protein